mgnify:CR=1 FL=1
MTREVMVPMTPRLQDESMKKLVLPIVVLVPFTVWSTWVAVNHGYFGFVDVARREPWGLQIFLDLCIALFLFSSWMKKDAKTHGIPAWPYLLSIPFLGSIGALAYLVHRAIKIGNAKSV